MSHQEPAISIDALRRGDLPAALRLQVESYPAFLVEDEDAFLSRMTLSASYCLAARQGDALLGYLLAHGWRRRSPPPVGTVLADGGPSEVLFVHDLTVASGKRGLRLGQRLIDRTFALAASDGLRSAELIAVEGAAPYWRGLGFVEEAVSGGLAQKLRTYGPQARWMTRQIPFEVSPADRL